MVEKEAHLGIFFWGLTVGAVLGVLLGLMAGRWIEADYAAKRCVDKCECPQGEIAP